MANLILQMLDEGRLIANDWSGQDDAGRETLCLYTALAGDASARPDTCPAELCPRWLAEMLPWIDDAGTESGTGERWRSIARRIGMLADRFGELQGERSERLRSRVCAIAVREGRSYVAAYQTQVLEAIDGVLALLDRHGSGGEVTDAEWSVADGAARAAAYAAAAGAAARAADAAGRAARAADAAARAAADAARTVDAARAAARTADAARAAARAASRAAADAAARAAADAAADRIIEATVAEIERELAA